MFPLKINIIDKENENISVKNFDTIYLSIMEMIHVHLDAIIPFGVSQTSNAGLP
jgi:hypothetical protein